MKKKIKCLSPLLLILLAFLFVGCNTSETEHGILSVQDGNGNVLYFGMSRSDAEETLGAGEEWFGAVYRYDYETSVLYRDDSAVSISVSSPGWRTYNGIEIGTTTREQLLEKYDFEILSDQYRDFSVFLDNNLEPTDEEEWKYVLTFFVDQNDDVVIGIIFADWSAATRLE